MQNETPQITTTPKATEPTKKVRTSPKILIIIVIGIVLGLGSWGVYASGVKSGKDQAARDAKIAAEKKLSSTAAIALPSSGTVSKINSKEVTIKLLGKETKSGKIDGKTVVTGKAGKSTVADIKEGDKIVLFTKTSGNDTVATRIMVQ
jgi:uncharacterized protein HemX